MKNKFLYAGLGAIAALLLQLTPGQIAACGLWGLVVGISVEKGAIK